MSQWTELPAEVRHLLNPAFCGRLIGTAVEAHREPFPFSLAFLVLPLVLHRPTRDLLPRSIRTPFPAWIESHARIRVGLAERARELVPFARAGVAFQLAANLIEVDEQGDLTRGPARHRVGASAASGSEEVQECITAAGLIGRWFYRTGDPATIYALCGVSP